VKYEARRLWTWFVRAFNTGHCGAGTIHANSAYDALLALEALILQSGIDVPARAVKEMVSRSIHIVVQLSQLPDHSRKVMEIAEVGGLDYEHSAGFPPYRLRSLYQFELSNYADRRARGMFVVKQRPTWIDELKWIPDYQLPRF
jgi:pilus assembly protein CpaF